METKIEMDNERDARDAARYRKLRECFNVSNLVDGPGEFYESMIELREMFLGVKHRHGELINDWFDRSFDNAVKDRK